MKNMQLTPDKFTREIKENLFGRPTCAKSLPKNVEWNRFK